MHFFTVLEKNAAAVAMNFKKPAAAAPPPPSRQWCGSAAKESLTELKTVKLIPIPEVIDIETKTNRNR
jgi:hypothetical protein